MSTYEADAAKVIADMQGGSLFDVTPERSQKIIAAALRAAAVAERQACANEVRALLDGADPGTSERNVLADAIAAIEARE